MAKLTCDHVTLEIRFRELDEAEWVQYDVLFLFDDRPIVNDALLKRNSEYWNRRTPGAFMANEYQRDSLIPMLEKMLSTNQPAHWTPLEPDVILAVYPEVTFPFLPSGWELVYESDKARHQREERERMKASAGKLPDDVFTLIAFVDAYNFGGTGAYSSNGPALILHPTRKEVEDFTAELKREYEFFLQTWEKARKGKDDVEAIFKGQVVTRSGILRAIQDFDSQYTDTSQYDDWLNKATYKFALRYANRLYPPKHILSQATGIPATKFSGGDQTNRVFRNLGFEIIDK